MTAVPAGDLASRVPAGAALVIDSSVVLAYLAGGEPMSEDAEQLFDRFVSTGRNVASLSVVTVGEILVRPFRQGHAAVAIAEGFLRHFAEMRLVDVTYDVAREGSRIRAATGLSMPDALIVASARIVEADMLVTGDRSWAQRLGDLASGLAIVELPLAIPG